MRARIEAAIKDAYYAARDNGGTMHTAAADATDAVLAVLGAPDEATVERLAEALVEDSWPVPRRVTARQHVEAVLTALAGTSAQARHTADATGGGEDG